MEMLSLFNQQVLQCQDDAYTLAWYLLGDEAEAEAAVQKAVEFAFQSIGHRGDPCRIRILRRVVRICRKQTAIRAPLSALHALPLPERQALVLIDVLGRTYPEAAAILEMPARQVAHLAAKARWKMLQSPSVRQVNC